MQTALLLLMLLAIAALPGSLYPQRGIDPAKTEQFLERNGSWGRFLDSIGMFNVYGSVWFSAIYLLLFISLIGCVIPRLTIHVRQLRSQPPRTPRRLDRFVGYTRWEVPLEDDLRPEQIAHLARTDLRGRRYRTRILAEGEAVSVSAERGYLRETGNLLFHLALVGVLIGVALGHLTQYRGQLTVVEGEGFSNSLSRYDSFSSGPWFDRSDLPDFQFTLKKFRATYETQPGRQFGQPRSFLADVNVNEPGRGTFDQTVQVNEPLSIPGADVFLMGNGYAPIIKITDRTGHVVADGPMITIPRDGNYTSQLIVKAPDAQPQQLALVGFFMPTATIDAKGPRSLYPDLLNPQIAATVYTGDLGLDGGIPRNAYQIDLTNLKPVTGQNGSPFLIRLTPGESITLPGGGSVSFEGVRRYAAFDVKHDPFLILTLVMSLTALFGLALSLFVPRRRMWVRAQTGTSVSGAPVLVIETAALARSEDYNLTRDVAALAARLGAPGPQDAQTDRSDGPRSPLDEPNPALVGENGLDSTSSPEQRRTAIDGLCDKGSGSRSPDPDQRGLENRDTRKPETIIPTTRNRGGDIPDAALSDSTSPDS